MNMPIKNEIYSIQQVYEFDHVESPCLLVEVQGAYHPIQDTDNSIEEILFALNHTEWQYKYTTAEYIPVYQSTNDILHNVHIMYIMDDPIVTLQSV